MPLIPESAPIFNFKHVGLSDPPFFGSVSPVYKDGDPEDTKSQETPFFNSRQFCCWVPAEFDQYNQLVDVLVKWRDRGWCQFTEVTEWVVAKENWISWIKYYALLQVPAEEIHLYLYEMNIMRMPTVIDTNTGSIK